MLDVAIRQAFSVRSGLSQGIWQRRGQMMSFDEGLCIRYANTQARQARVFAEGVVAEPHRQEGQTASQVDSARDSVPSEVEILRQTVA